MGSPLSPPQARVLVASGEEVLARFLPEGFRHNQQSVRIVDARIRFRGDRRDKKQNGYKHSYVHMFKT